MKGVIVEKSQLVNVVAKIMENSGFKVYKDFKTSQAIIDIYGVLPTVMGDFGVVVACKNYDKEWDVGIDVVKEMEMIGKALKASKVTIVTNSNFSSQAINYASRRNIKLIDKKNLILLAKKFSENKKNLPDNMKDLKTPQKKNRHDDSNDSVYVSDNRFNNRNKKVLNPNRENIHHARLDNRSKSKEPNLNLNISLKSLFNNTIFLIVLVVIASYLISFILGSVTTLSNGIMGLIKIISSLILSYTIVFTVNKDLNITLFKGSTVFFISLIILILMIVLM